MYVLVSFFMFADGSSVFDAFPFVYVVCSSSYGFQTCGTGLSIRWACNDKKWLFDQVDSFHALRRSDPPFVTPSSLLQQGLSPLVLLLVFVFRWCLCSCFVLVGVSGTLLSL
jgi:hypothetical protein